MTDLIVVDPPSTGDNFSVPGRTVADSHGSSLRQAARGNGITWDVGGKICQN